MDEKIKKRDDKKEEKVDIEYFPRSLTHSMEQLKKTYEQSSSQLTSASKILTDQYRNIRNSFNTSDIGVSITPQKNAWEIAYEKQAKKFTELEDKINKSELDQLENIKVQQEKIKNQDERIKENKKLLQSSQVRIIEVMGIFVALFTFVSISINVLREIESLSSAMYFLLFLAGLMGLLVLIINLSIGFLNDLKRWNLQFILLLVTFTIFILIGFLGASMFNY